MDLVTLRNLLVGLAAGLIVKILYDIHFKKKMKKMGKKHPNTLTIVFIIILILLVLVSTIVIVLD